MIKMDRSIAEPEFNSRIYVWQIIQLLQLSTADDPNIQDLKQHHLIAHNFVGWGFRQGSASKSLLYVMSAKAPACGCIQLVTALGWQTQDGLTHWTRPSYGCRLAHCGSPHGPSPYCPWYHMDSVSSRITWTSLHGSQYYRSENIHCKASQGLPRNLSLSLHSFGQSKSQTTAIQGEGKWTSPLDRNDKVTLKTWRNSHHHFWK